jgi:hypothetical protein
MESILPSKFTTVVENNDEDKNIHTPHMNSRCIGLPSIFICKAILQTAHIVEMTLCDLII